MKAKESKSLDALTARNAIAAPESALAEFMYMPGGLQKISCTKGTKQVDVEVIIDQAAAQNLQKQLDLVKGKSAHRPYFDFNHDDEEASFWPESFAWRDTPKPGVYVRGEWSAKGREAVSGKMYRAFSPVFHVDNEKAKPARVICADAAGLNFGGLVNSPAFRENLPFWAKHSGTSPGAQTQHHKMNEEQMAALRAKIATMEHELAGLQAADNKSAESAELIVAKNNELQAGKLELERAELHAENAELQKQIHEVRASQAKEHVRVAVARGAIKAKDAATQAFWETELTNHPEKITALNAVGSSPALAPSPITARSYAPNVIISRESNFGVLKSMGGLIARNAEVTTAYKDKVGLARDFAAIYAKEIVPRLKEGDDIPLSAADALGNTLGTLAATITSVRTLELLTLTFPSLKAIATDFSDQIVSYGDTLKTRFVGIPAVVTYDQTNGWSSSGMTTTDVSITYNQLKGVQIVIDQQTIAGTIRRLFDEIAPAQAYALGKDMVDYVYAIITAAAFANTPTTGATAPSFGRSTVIDVGGALDDNGNPEMGRTLLLNRPVFSQLAKDSTIITMAAFSRNQIITDGMNQTTLPNVEGFNVIKAVNLPGTAIGGATLKGFGFTKSALCLATRLSADYASALAGANNGNLTVVSTPAGFSANQVQFVNHILARSYQRLEVIYGASAGQPLAGQILTN